MKKAAPPGDTIKIIDPGHTYALKNNKSSGSTILRFYKDPDINGSYQPGTSNQEVLRALLNRMYFLDSQKSWELNSVIITNLRRALNLHELRALEYKLEPTELWPVGRDGHWRNGSIQSPPGN